MRDKNFIPEDMDKELDIRIDAGNKMAKDIWVVINRHLHESAITYWEVLGCLDTVHAIFMQKYQTEAIDEEEFPGKL